MDKAVTNLDLTCAVTCAVTSPVSWHCFIFWPFTFLASLTPYLSPIVLIHRFKMWFCQCVCHEYWYNLTPDLCNLVPGANKPRTNPSCTPDPIYLVPTPLVPRIQLTSYQPPLYPGSNKPRTNPPPSYQPPLYPGFSTPCTPDLIPLVPPSYPLRPAYLGPLYHGYSKRYKSRITGSRVFQSPFLVKHVVKLGAVPCAC